MPAVDGPLGSTRASSTRTKVPEISGSKRISLVASVPTTDDTYLSFRIIIDRNGDRVRLIVEDRLGAVVDTAVLTTNLPKTVNLQPFAALQTLDNTGRDIIHFGQVAEIRLPT